MAFESLGYASQSLVTGTTTIDWPTDVRPYTAWLDLTGLVGCTLEFRLIVTMATGLVTAPVWYAGPLTVAADTTGLSVPPWPSNGSTIQLEVELSAGTPNSIGWELFGL